MLNKPSSTTHYAEETAIIRAESGAGMCGQVRDDGIPPLLWVLLGSLTAALLAFSQTVALYGDEGFHLLAARLVTTGKRPYLDFFYPHAPLYIYVAAACMRVFGDTWRSVHALSALLTSGCIALMTWYVFSRSRGSGWRLANAAAAALLMALNVLVIWFGTIGQAYALSLFLIFAAFLLVVGSVDRTGGARPFLAGLSAGGAASSLLLTAPVAPILFLWLLRHAGPRDGFRKCAYFLAGTLLPFLPLLWLAVQAPGQVLFDVFAYHLLYRATWTDRSWSLLLSLRTLSSWLSSPQALLLILLAAIALTFLVRPGDRDERREFRLCAWLAAGLALFLAIPMPTFPQYFVLVVPFVSILASLGINLLGSHLWPAARPAHVLLPLVFLFALGLARPAFQLRQNSLTWVRVEDLAREVNRVTPSDGLIYAPELVLFAARRLPPPGMENAFASLLALPAERLASLHVVPQSQIDTWLAAGRFHTVVIGTGDSRVQSLGLLHRYSEQGQRNPFYILSHPVTEADQSGLLR